MHDNVDFEDDLGAVKNGGTCLRASNKTHFQGIANR